MAASVGRTNLTRMGLNIFNKISNRYLNFKPITLQGLLKNHSNNVSNLKRNVCIENNFGRMCIRRSYSTSGNVDSPPSESSDTSTDGLADTNQISYSETDVLKSSDRLAYEKNELSDIQQSLKYEKELTTSNVDKLTEALSKIPSEGDITDIIDLKSTEGVELYTEDEIKQVEFEEEADALFIRIDLVIKSIDRAVLKSYLMFLQMAALGLDIKFETKPMPKFKVERYSILKSVHVYKKHYRQYERRTHYLMCSIHKVTGSTASVFLEYIQRNLPEGVAMTVEKHQIEMVPEHLKQPIQQVDSATVEDKLTNSP